MINSLISVNNKVSITKFEFILKTLFVRMEYKNSEDFQNDKSLARKSQLSDILIELIKLGFSSNRGLLKKKIYI